MRRWNKNLPVFVHGWEDSTLGNIFAANCITADIKNINVVKSGMEYLIGLADWYLNESADHSIGFFQIGGGIAGDFAICVVPILREDIKKKDIPLWGYCQLAIQSRVMVRIRELILMKR